jgi:hypothetical protein
MAKLIISLFLNCLPFLSLCQFQIDGENRKIVFAPMNNVIQLMNFGDCKDLIVKIDSFSQNFSFTDCTFNLNFLLRDTSEVLVIKNGIIIFRDTLYEVDVKSSTYLNVGGMLISNGNLMKSDLSLIQGIEVIYNDPNLISKIKEFTVIVKDKAQGVQAFVNSGKQIDQETKSYLHSLQQPSTIWIENIINVALFEHDMCENLSFEIK